MLLLAAGIVCNLAGDIVYLNLATRGVYVEGGPLDRAPRASILAETLVLQALSVLLQSEAKVTPQQYVKWHPGGSLGHLRENER